jgi:hypothetical protein
MKTMKLSFAIGLLILSAALSACAQPHYSVSQTTPTETVQSPAPESCPAPIEKINPISNWCGRTIVTINAIAYWIDTSAGTSTALQDGIQTIPNCTPWGGCQKPCEFLVIKGIPGAINSNTGGWSW